MATKEVNEKHSRLEGLDLARYVALVGMVFVNFGVVMVTPAQSAGRSAQGDGTWIVHLLQGRAAATFVVLAGLGLGLSAKSRAWRSTFATTLKRAVFLLALGLLNMLIFDADIIHYYAFYFFLGVFFLRAPTWSIATAITLLLVCQVMMVIGLNYDAGWNWATYTYSDFWTPAGFFRNLFFNGWHPVIPWFGFLLFGIGIARLQLGETKTQIRLFVIGALVFTSSMLASSLLMSDVASTDPEAAILFTTAPVPPMPLYMFAGGGIACVVIGLCLMLSKSLSGSRIYSFFTAAGRQSLTLYIAHILIGMGTLEAFGMIGGQTTGTAILASIVFCIFATAMAAAWNHYFRRGPLETLMRKVAG